MKRIADNRVFSKCGKEAQYEKIVKTIYSKLNVNLGDFSQQLESVCQQFENLDDDMKTQLS